MKKKPKPLRPNKEAIREVFPPEVVEELDRIISEVDDAPRMENPHKRGARPIKPWGKKWAKSRAKV